MVAMYVYVGIDVMRSYLVMVLFLAACGPPTVAETDGTADSEGSVVWLEPTWTAYDPPDVQGGDPTETEPDATLDTGDPTVTEPTETDPTVTDEIPEDDPTLTPDWPSDWADMEDVVLDLVNEWRASGADCDTEGVFPPAGPLTMNSALRDAARLHSEDMGANNYFSHDSLDGRDFVDRILDAGYDMNGPVGENIAAGQNTPQAAVQGWMDSDGHCANIMNASFDEIGVGYAYDASSTYRHYWTQDFGG